VSNDEPTSNGEHEGAPGIEPGLVVPHPAAPLIAPAKWGEPLVVIDRAWNRFEIWLALGVFCLEALSMSLWVCLKGFSAPGDQPAALAFRAAFGGTVLGTTAYLALRKQRLVVRNWATVASVLFGFLLAKAWLGFGVAYASNLLNWYQQASFLTLLGGLRGVGTRLTMLLALVGGSLATGRGRHIVIDIVTRFVSLRTRTIMVLIGWVATAFVCIVAAWGFLDHISIENFGARADQSPTEKIGRVASQLGEDFFIARKQAALDFITVPHVLRGEIYSEFLTGKEWNTWVDAEGFSSRYGREATETLKIPPEETRSPIVVIPGRGEPRGELINAAYLVFPIGLMIIAARFVLRGLLVASGHASVDTDESEEWGESKV